MFTALYDATLNSWLLAAPLHVHFHITDYDNNDDDEAEFLWKGQLTLRHQIKILIDHGRNNHN